jgi:succinate dehydrogenase / fumarate reductase flavoprotein subunit
VHGANRLGGNSLLEAVVFGRRAGQSAARFCADAPLSRFPDTALEKAAFEVASILQREEGESPAEIREEMNTAMAANCGVFRDREKLQKGLDTIRELKVRYKNVALTDKGDYYNNELLSVIELGAMLDVSESIFLGALNREESRGAHSRLDFPKRNDDEWLKHTLITKDPATGELKIEYKPVTITRFTPEERKY